MANLAVSVFLGMQPRVGPKMLEDSKAVAAQNIHARSGYLVGRCENSTLGQPVTDGTKFAYRLASEGTDAYLEFTTTDVSVTPSPLVDDAYDRYYWAGEGFAPRFNTKERIENGDPAYTLGVPRLNTRPTVTLVDAGTSSETETRFYVVTYVDIYGEESAPTYPRRIKNINTDAVYEVAWDERSTYGSSRAPLEKVRLWRTIPGEASTAFFFVDEIDILDGPYEDDNDPDDVAQNEVLSSTIFDEPPSDLQGLVATPNGFLAGWRGRDVYFSVPYLPHAWPASYVLTVKDTIVGLGVFGTSIAILTNGTPYVATGVNPEAMSLTRVGPNAACLSRRSIVEVPGAVIYASEDGLASIDVSGQRILTANLITREDWNLRYSPDTLIAATDGETTYIGFYDGTNGFELDFAEPMRGFIDVSFPDGVDGFNLDPEGRRPLLISGTTVYRFGGNLDTYGTYLWKSKKFFLTRPLNFGAAQINRGVDPRDDTAGSATFKLYANDVLVYDQPVTFDTPFRLPSGFKAENWQFELEGDAPISRVMIAETERELAAI